MSATTPPTPDGDQLTRDYVSRNGAGASADVRNVGAQRLIALGYITAVALPLFGLVLGIVLVTRPGKAHFKHGVAIIVISIIATVVWFLIFNSGVINTTTSDFS